MGGGAGNEGSRQKNDQNPIKKRLGHAYHQKEKKTKTKTYRKKYKRKVTENRKARGKRMARPKREKEDPSDQTKRENKNLHLVFRGPQQQLAKLNLIAVVVHI